jgi:hypothetical protein
VRYTITIAERSLVWTFSESDRLDAWLAGSPWSNSGSLAVVRLSSPGAIDSTVRALRRLIRAADDGAEVRVDELNAAEEGLVLACAERIGLSRALGDLERIDLLAEKLAIRPRVFVLQPGICSLDEARELVERLEKHRSEPNPTLIFLDTLAHPVSGDGFDLTIGWPVQPLFKEPGISARQLWPTYLHHRVAWEAGGVPERSMKWDSGSLAALNPKDDEAFEAWLNNRARRSVAEFSTELIALLVDFFDRTLGLTKSELPRPDTGPRLRCEGLIWRPPGAAAVQPVPFVARALLLDDDDTVTPLKSLLRSCLVCKPLAHEVLARCLELEARERAIVRALGDLFAPSFDLERRWQAFNFGDSPSNRHFYPAGCPSCPEDAWTFAPFGELLGAARRRLPKSEHRHAIRRLRNALAHGMYVSWSTITTLMAAERELV